MLDTVGALVEVKGMTRRKEYSTRMDARQAEGPMPEGRERKGKESALGRLFPIGSLVTSTKLKVRNGTRDSTVDSVVREYTYSNWIRIFDAAAEGPARCGSARGSVVCPVVCHAFVGLSIPGHLIPSSARSLLLYPNSTIESRVKMKLTLHG